MTLYYTVSMSDPNPQNKTVKPISFPDASALNPAPSGPAAIQPNMPDMPKRPNEGIGGRHPNHPKEHK